MSDGILIRDLRRLEMPLSDIALALERSEPERKELVEGKNGSIRFVATDRYRLAIRAR